MIQINNLTRDYGDGKGIFDISFSVNKGEVFGLLGPNGAGKTTLIRHLMGFIQAKNGCCLIDNQNCFFNREQIQKDLGYIPGEINLLDDMTGLAYLQFVKDYKQIKKDRIQELSEYFEFNPNIKIKKMSKGMKQKLGIISCMMHDPGILIFDEPTSGLDPLMQKRFIDLVLREKERGKTIFLSSHIFDEVQRTCDRIGILRKGKLITVENVQTLRKKHMHTYTVTLNSQKEAHSFAKDFEGICFGNQVTLSNIQSLESIFMDYYGGDYD